jgi:hypothetical protein
VRHEGWCLATHRENDELDGALLAGGVHGTIQYLFSKK